MPLSGTAAAVTPTTPATTAPATPAATGTPQPTGTGTSTSTAGVTAPRPGTGTGTGSGSLAETGAPVAGIAGLGVLIGLLGFGAVAGLAVARRRREHKQ